MKKSSLLLLDANVVIELCEAGLWVRVLERCEILLARTVFEESFFYKSDIGDQVYFSLEEDERAGRLTIVEVPPKEILAFTSQFHEGFGSIDPGEAESLTYLCSRQVDHLICSADHIVFRVLGALGRGEQGISLAEVLKRCGLTKKDLARKFGEEFRKDCTKHGEADALQGKAFKKK